MVDGWQRFLELGRSRGWFLPENRPFLVELVGEETAKGIPLEPKESNNKSGEENSNAGEGVDIIYAGEVGNADDTDAEGAEGAAGAADTEDAGSAEDSLDTAEDSSRADGEVSSSDESEEEEEDSDEEEEDTTTKLIKKGTNEGTPADDDDTDTDTDTNTATDISDREDALETEDPDEQEESEKEESEKEESEKEESGGKEVKEGESEAESDQQIIASPTLDKKSEENPEDNGTCDNEVPDFDQQDGVPTNDYDPGDEVDVYADYSDDEMESDSELQSLMVQEMMKMRQQRLAEGHPPASTQLSPTSADDSEGEEKSDKFEQAREATDDLGQLYSQLASLDIQANPSQRKGDKEEEERPAVSVPEATDAVGAAVESERGEPEHQPLDYDHEDPVHVVRKKIVAASVGSDAVPATPHQPLQHQDELDSPPPLTVTKRRAVRIVIDSDDDLPPPSHRKVKPRPKAITISDDSEGDSDKENQRAAVNRPTRVFKRDSTSDCQLSRTKQILLNARKRFQSSDSESGDASEGSNEGRGDWIQTDEDRSEDEDGDLSDFVVPDGEVEDNHLDDEEEYNDSGDGGDGAHSQDSEDYSDGFEEIEESDGSDGEVNDRVKYVTPTLPSKPKTPASRPTFYSVKTTPKYPVILPKTPQTNKKRNFDLQIARELYDEFNAKVFGNRLPEDLPISWSVTLRSTAGYCKHKRVNGVYTASIDLALKVLDDMDRLRSTLIHEMCHAAVWLLDHSNESHGPLFYNWGRKAERIYPDLEVSRCHNYEIEYKFTYVCSNPSCGVKVGRHSKSLDTNRKVCRRCHSEFKLAPRVLKNGAPARAVTPSAFSVFLKENLGRTKKEHPNTPHKDVMAILVAKYNEMKIAK